MPPAHHPAPFEVGLIGVTGYGHIYLDLLRAAGPRVRLRAATVLPSQLDLPVVDELRASGTDIHVDYASMLTSHAGKLDLCMIPTPIHWHSRMTRAALMADANVLVEKPLAGSLGDAEKILITERAMGRWVAVGFQDVYTAEVAWLKRRLLDGAIGRIRRVSTIGMWPRGRRYYERNDWAGRIQVDGVAVLDSPLGNAFAHFVNLALFLGGPGQEHAAQVDIIEAELRRAHPIETFDTAVVRCRDRDDPGLRFWFGFTHACAIDSRPEILVEGDSGTARWVLEGPIVLSPEGGPVEVRQAPDYAATRQAMFDAVLARLADGTTPVFGCRQAMEHVALVEGLQDQQVALDFPAELVRWQQVGGESNVPVVNGLDDALLRAWVADSTLASVNPAFASIPTRR